VDLGLPELRLKVPCDDVRDFRARLGHHVAANGLCIPTERGLAVSTRVAVTLVFRDGSTLCGEGIVDAHKVAGGRSAVRVRLPTLGRAPARPGPARDALEDEPLGDPWTEPRPAPEGDEPLVAAVVARLLPPRAAEPAEERQVLAPAPPLPGGAFETSGDIFAAVNRRADRAQRGALVLVALALALAGAGFAIARHLTPEAAPGAQIAAHLRAAERLEAEGRLLGEGGAIEELLAARRLEPANAETEARLSQVADRLEALGARALQRNDLAAASTHLAAAQVAAPERPSIRAKLDAVEKRLRRAEVRRRRSAAAAR
jgi:hypothetical protein